MSFVQNNAPLVFVLNRGLFFYCFKTIYLFIWLHYVLVVVCRIFFCLSCNMQNLQLWHLTSQLQHVGSQFLDQESNLPPTPALGGQRLSHWTTREVPSPLIYELWMEVSLDRPFLHQEVGVLASSSALMTSDWGTLDKLLILRPQYLPWLWLFLTVCDSQVVRQGQFWLFLSLQAFLQTFDFS